MPATNEDNELPLWTVYDHPTDYPDAYVARQWIVGVAGVQHTERMMAHHDIEPIRTALANMGLTRLERNPEDDPVIMETWV